MVFPRQGNIKPFLMEGNTMRSIFRNIVVISGIVVLCLLLGCNNMKFDTAKELSELFCTHREEFQFAKNEVLGVMEIYNFPIWIESESSYRVPTNKRSKVKEIQNLYFTTTDHMLAEDDYYLIYDAVAYLFSDLKINGIFCSANEVQFCIESVYGVEASIIFTLDDVDPSGSYSTIQERTEIENGWFAIIVHD